MMSRIPKAPKAVAVDVRSRYLTLAAELLATPGLYSDSLQALGIVPSNLPQTSPLPGNIESTSLSDLARFYASQGISIEMADDAALYAFDWLSSAKANEPFLTMAIRSARNRTESAIRAGIFPAGLNDNYASSEGTVPGTSFSIPGTVFLPPPPAMPEEEGLPYGDPAESSATIASSSTSLSRTRAPQTSTPVDREDE